MIKWIQDNFTSIVAATGFLISIYNFAEARIANRKNFQFTIEHTHVVQGRLLLIVSVVNRSRLPVTLTSCRLFLDGKEHRAGARSTIWYTYNDPVIKGRTGERTTAFPIKLESLGYFFGVLEVSDWKNSFLLNVI